MKRAPKVEARFSVTAILHPATEHDEAVDRVELTGGAMRHARFEALKWTDARAVVLVEKDPAADAVVKAAERYVDLRFRLLNTQDAVKKLEAAVSRLQKARK